MEITKEGKARWVYRCPLCNATRYAPDQLRILEARTRHIRGNPDHFIKAITEAVKPVIEAYAAAARRIIEVLKPVQTQMDYVLMPPPNTPHDPSLRADKRKWGGK